MSKKAKQPLYSTLFLAFSAVFPTLHLRNKITREIENSLNRRPDIGRNRDVAFCPYGLEGDVMYRPLAKGVAPFYCGFSTSSSPEGRTAMKRLKEFKPQEHTYREKRVNPSTTTAKDVFELIGGFIALCLLLWGLGTWIFQEETPLEKVAREVEAAKEELENSISSCERSPLTFDRPQHPTSAKTSAFYSH